MIKMIEELRRRMNEYSEKFSKLEDVKKTQTELKKMITDLKIYILQKKSTVEEEQTSELEDSDENHFHRTE